jgi:hypothetical protein
MTKDKTQNLSAYFMAIAVFRKFLSDGLITQTEYYKIASKIAEEYNVSLCSIYRIKP